jgi:RimJ/RimL family protein N-acetyltransferase
MRARKLIDEAADAAEADAAAADPAGALAALFDALAAHDWPVAQLERRLPKLLDLAGALAADARCAWLDGLHRVWRRHGWALSRAARLDLLQLACGWCAWPLAHAVGVSLAADGALEGEHALRMLGACRHLGDVDGALDLAVRLQLAHPDKSAYAEAHRELLAWLDWRDGMPVIDGADWGDDALRLEPMAHHHLADFAWQYADPAIAELCCLPSFQRESEWHDWLDAAYRGGEQRVFAVMHAEWGCVGSVSLAMHRAVGFFYYWLGPDFQGQGLGPRAVALLLAAARRDYGLRCCYAKAYDYNAPSRRALAKLGFAELGICGVAPDDDQLFYRHGEAAPQAALVDELHQLLDDMGSETRAAAPLRLQTAERY